METKYTPGPWKIYRRRGIIQSIIGNDTYASVLSPLTEPNANLIAAAPDLLEALKDSLNAIYNCASSEVIEKVENVIAKVEGRRL